MVTTFSWRQPRSWSLLLLCLLLLCLLLTGCATRVIYYWLDSAIVWQLDDYFSLDRSQKKLLDQEVKGLMAWHRQHELPIYARDLDALAKAVASPMSPAQVTLHLDRTQASLTRTLENAIPRTVRLAKTLTDEQVARFKDAMDDDFNTPEAYSALFDLVREINRQKAEDIAVAAGLGARLRELGAVLGILQQDPDAFLKGIEADEEVAEIERLIAERNQARADKNWAAADAARNRLTEMGIVLEDSAGKTSWRRA